MNNIMTSFGRLLIDVDFTTLSQGHGMVDQRLDVKTTTIQRRYDVVYPLGRTLIHIQNSLHIQKPEKIKDEVVFSEHYATVAYKDCWYIKNLNSY